MTNQPDSEINPIPFTGRESTYARLKQHILDPPEIRAYTLTGRRGIGKSALLQHFGTLFDDTILSIYSPLHALAITTESDWWLWLRDEINALLEAHDFSLSRLESMPPDDVAIAGDDRFLRDWFINSYVPDVLHVIRPHRHLVWLIDDAELLPAIADDLPQVLYDLLQQQDQLSIIVALNTDYDDALAELAPLIDAARAERLHSLDYDAVADLLQQTAPGLSDDALQTIYREIGGYPPLVNRYIVQLSPRWGRIAEGTALADARAEVYDDSKSLFRDQWRSLGRDERLILTALSSLIYDDPLRPVTAKQIEAWLVETDFPMDIVAINAALRGLDFRGIVRNEPAHVQVAVGLQQQWLMEFARLDHLMEVDTGSEGWQWYWWLLVAALILISAGIIISLGFPAAEAAPVIPTVTLGS